MLLYNQNRPRMAKRESRPNRKRRAPRIFVSVAALVLLRVPLGAADVRPGSSIVRLPVSEGKDLRFRHLALGEAPSHLRVNEIVQDDLGFLWLATSDGLKRYDGYRIRDFHHEADNPNSPTDNYTYTVFKDRVGKIWIANGNRYVQTYDPATETFTLIRLDPKDPAPLKARVGEFKEDRAGFIWLSTDTGLYGIDSASGRTVHYEHDPKNAATLSSSIVRSTLETQDGSFWVATSAGLDNLDRRTGKVARKIPFPTPNSEWTKILQDHSGVIWMAYNEKQGGLARLDPGSDELKQYQLLVPHDEESWPGVKTIYEDGDGNLWIGTIRAGLYMLDRDRKLLVRYRNSPTDAASLASNEIAALFEDREGGIWVGTRGDGADRFTSKPLFFHRYAHEAGNPNSLEKDVVIAVFEDSHGMLWLAGSRKLLELDRKTGKPSQPIPHLPGEMVYSIAEDRSGSLWFGVAGGGGLSRFDPRTGSLKTYRHDKNNPRSLSNDEVRSILIDHNGTLWAGTDDGLNAFDPQTGEFRVYAPPVKPSTYRTIVEDSKGQLWISSAWSGVHRFDPATGKFTVYQHSDKAGSLNNDAVNAVCVGRSGMVWLGTEEGLASLDPASGIFKTYDLGPPNSAVNGILEDARGNLWLGTNSGLLRFDPDGQVLRRYSMSDGLAGNEFPLNGAVWKSPRGEMFFGSYGGLTYFYPEQIVDAPYSPPVRLTDVQILGKPVSIGHGSPLKRSISVTNSIILNHAQSVLSFEFAALSYTDPERNRYRYRLEGLDDKWYETDSSRRFVTYTNLAPGGYIFRVQGSDNLGDWNENGVSLRIRVLAPWWATIWFRSLCGAGFLGLLWAGYQFRLRQLRHEFNMRVEGRVEERTRIARELHDTLLQSFQGLIPVFQAARNLLPGRADRAAEVLDDGLTEAAAAVVEGRNAIQNLRSNPSPDRDLESLLTAAWQELGNSPDPSGHAPECRVIVEGSPQKIAPLIQDEIYRIGREMLRNAFRHAHAARIEVEIRYEAKRFRLQIRDDGKGIEASVLKQGASRGHWGLPGMYERARRMGGHLKIWSESGAGTEAELTVPARVAYPKFSDRHRLWNRFSGRFRSNAPNREA
jgi:ligand-binding sensor domain-containing protein/signal transduction histidine kinase